MQNLPYLIIIFSAFGGFLISFYIHHKKSSNEVMICPLNFDCETVIYSQYSKFFGIPLEFLGMTYYAAIAISYAFIMSSAQALSSTLSVLVLTASLGAFLFSLYLTFLQMFNLKQFCTWCLFSAGLSTIILVSALSVWAPAREPLIRFLTNYYDFISALHVLALAIGLGGATISEILFLKFLKDFKISEEESDILYTLSQVIWLSLGVSVVTIIGVYLPHADKFSMSALFSVKVVLLLFIIINGAVLNLLISPKLVNISFGGKHDHEAGELKQLRRLAFALSAISIISWYFSFIVTMLENSSWTSSQIFSLYLVIIFVGLILSQAAERGISKRV